MYPPILTIILNFNRPDKTVGSLVSLSTSDYPNNHVVVLDANAKKRIPQEIIDNFPWVEFKCIEENKGYAGNNNFGINYAIEKGAEWIFILNDDTVVAPDCLSNLVSGSGNEMNVGIVGPLILHGDETSIIQSAGGIFDNFWHPIHRGMNEEDKGQFVNIDEVSWVNGCGFLCNAKIFKESLIYFDENFYLYNEEVDLCFRARAAGWKILFNPHAKLWHDGVNRDYQPTPDITYYMVRNFLLFLNKNRAPERIKMHAWYENLRMVASYTLRPKWRHARDHRDAAVQGMRDYLLRRWGKRG